MRLFGAARGWRGRPMLACEWRISGAEGRHVVQPHTDTDDVSDVHRASAALRGVQQALRAGAAAAHDSQSGQGL